jgi:hypothetical protein
MKILLRFLAVAAALLPLACNAARVDESAPPLDAGGTSWVRPDGETAAVETEGRWVLVEFFSPT